MPESALPLRFRFGPFELHPAERRLFVAGQPVLLNSRAFDVLVVLAEHAGQLVSKDDLLARAWPGLVVEEGNLQVQVSYLRKALGADVIQTVAGHGYRLTHDVAAVAEAAADPVERRHNLPYDLTSFVGRDVELAEQTRRFAQTRLLTITGAGGLGKSRLSLKLAAGVGDAYTDGVWLVELAAVADAQQVTAAFAAVLGVADARGGSLREAVVGYVQDRRLLLILDNCEHVLSAVAELAVHLLQVAPLIKLIATSREPLLIAGEMICPLSPLPVPESGPGLSVEAAGRNEAIQLFVARAAAAQSDFALTSRNVAPVAEICRRVDGIPLALELAAARIRSLSVEGIAKRLDDRLRLLNTGDRTAHARHQTLRATIDWSHDLLTMPERELLRRLAVCAGGFTLGSAEALASGGATGADDVLDLLANLVDKSLVTASQDRERYSMLDTIRQYALERLAESGEEAQVRAEHAAHFVAVAEAAEPELIGPDQGARLARLECERQNFLAAHAWCAQDAGDARLGLRLACALRMFWQSKGPLQLGYQLTVDALNRDGAQVRDYSRCQALFAAGVYSYFLGQSADARRYGEDCLAIARERNDPDKVSDVLVLLGAVALADANAANARECVTEAIALARMRNDDVRLAQAVNLLGDIHSTDANLVDAESSYEESLALMRKLGELGSVAGALTNLARIAATHGAATRAATYLREAADIVEETGTQHTLQHWLAIAGGFAAAQGDWQRAAWLSGALALRSRLHGMKLEAVDGAFLALHLARAREMLDASAFGDAEAAGAARTDHEVFAQMRDWLGDGAKRA